VQFFCFVRVGRTVRGVSADGPRRCCSSGVLRILARLSFRSVVALSFGWAKFRMVRVSRADGPRVPGGQSACPPRTVCFSRFATGGSVRFNGRSAAQAGQSAARVRTAGRSARPTADSLPCLAGRSARGWQLCFLVRFLPSFLVLPRVLQGIVPKTRG
jgi:hypothetical protein